jgi:hypothetical protein
MQPVRADSPDRRIVGRTRRAGCGLLLVAAIAVTSSLADAVDDLPGWQNTRWGMTETEVTRTLGAPLTTLPASLARSLDAVAALTTSVEMAGSHYDAILLFPDDTRRLGRVLIRTLDYSREHALMLHATLQRALTRQYGPPGETESGGSTASLERWTFKTTTVVLSMYTDTSLPGRHVTQVAVTYAPTATAPQDAKDKLLGLGLLRALSESGLGAQ